MEVFKNASLNGVLCDITSENGVITYIGKTNLSGADLCGMEIRAGLIDIHTHGAAGFDTMDASLCELSDFQLAHGVTTFMPTTMTDNWDRIKAVTDADITNTNGANIWGFHFEGPYINKKYRGAQNEKYIRLPDIHEFEGLKNIKMLTIAPELDNALEFISRCKAVVSIGHTDSDYNTAISAIEAGAACLTHTFNAMPPLNHRNPGVVGAAIDKNLYVQVICDGLHIHPAIIRMLYKLFGKERMILISDSMRATGLGDGDYEFGGQTVSVRNSVAKTSDGAIAGSTSTLFDCVKKAIEFGICEDDAFYMASAAPAKLMGMNKGIIKCGCDCDFIVLNSNKTLSAAVVGGELRYGGKKNV